MCDTIVALHNSTKSGRTLFGKNSDREPDEAQNLVSTPARENRSGSSVRCTYISIPEAETTYATLLCQPFWMWGAEMGLNEHGVSIGNEALFTRVKPEITGLTGMDLLRLALERSTTAKQALAVIIELIREHGQGGNCGYRHDFRYMNGFLICDHEEGYVLETVGRMWAWKAIKDFWSISNVISITDDFDSASPDLVDFSVDRGWCGKKSGFNFRMCYSDRLFTWGAKGLQRQERTRKLLGESAGRLDEAAFISILRDHGDLQVHRPSTRPVSVCMHAAEPFIKRSQTVNSMVASLGKDGIRAAATGSSSPCITQFFPLPFPGRAMPSGYKASSADFNADAHWWRHEMTHRRLLLDGKLDAISKEIQSLLESRESALFDHAEKSYVEMEAIEKEIEILVKGCPSSKPGWFYKMFWKKLNRINRIPASTP